MSSPMITLVPTIKSIYHYLTSNNTSQQSILLPPVPTHEIETAAEKRPRTLKHLIRANHINHSILYHELIYHNHMSHLLGSAYILGASVDQMQKIYDVESKELEEWQDSPAEITDQDWRNFLGDKRYQRAYVDFYEDESALKFGYDWKRVVEEYMFSGKEPLIHGIVGGLGHPLIHLGYAYELNIKELGIEALSMTSTCYSPLHKYLSNPSYTIPPSPSTPLHTPLQILHKLHGDPRFNDLFPDKGPHNIPLLFQNHESLILEYWNLWIIGSDPIKQFQDSQDAAIALLLRTVKPGTHSYDFFVVHLLTTSHAIRILLPSIPQKFHVSLVRQWWLFALSVYITQLRPEISEDLEVAPKKSWKYVEDVALNGEWAQDAHFVKALRAIREAAFTWGDVHEIYLGSAVQLADDFKGWV